MEQIYYIQNLNLFSNFSLKNILLKAGLWIHPTFIFPQDPDPGEKTWKITTEKCLEIYTNCTLNNTFLTYIWTSSIFFCLFFTFQLFFSVVIGFTFSKFKKSHRSFLSWIRIHTEKAGRSGSALRKTAGSGSAKNDNRIHIPQPCLKAYSPDLVLRISVVREEE